MIQQPMQDLRILIVDDSRDSLDMLEEVLSPEYKVSRALSGEEGLEVLAQQQIDLIITDQFMPGMSGTEFLETAQQHYPRTVRILVTGNTNPDDLIRAINQGNIYKFISKPFRPQELRLAVHRALEYYQMERENERLYKELQGSHERLKENYVQLQTEMSKREVCRQIVGNSQPIQNIFNDIQRISDSDITVLIMGETGTGKELIARAIHQAGPRRDKNFIVQDCGSIPDTLLESELFGHKKGAFTGAVSDKRGLLEVADGGTIFLDEIGETSPAMQVRLLRFLQEGELRPVGSETVKKVDVRVMSATHRDLQEEIRRGSFRADLFYRISTYPITVPPLRMRREDLPVLAAHFLSKFNVRHKRPNKRLSREAINVLMMHDFPGNIRELENEIERAATVSENSDLIFPEHLSERIREAQRSQPGLGAGLLEGRRKLSEMVGELEKNVIQAALKRHRGNKTRVAGELGLSRLGLRKKMIRYGMEAGKGQGSRELRTE